MGLLSTLGSTGVISGLTSILGNLSTNYTNQNIANQNLQYQRDANAQNIAFQREINDTNYYRQLAENNLTREREDTAVQRAMNDVTNAGLSKTLATGLSASSSSQSASTSQAPKVEALRNEFKYQSILKDLNLLDIYTKVQESKANIDNIKASTNNINAQAEYTKTQDSLYALKAISEYNKNESTADYYKAESNLVNLTSQSTVDKLKADVTKLQADTDFTKAQIKYILTNTQKVSSEVKIAEQNYIEKVYDFNLSQKYGTYSDGAKSSYGKIAQDISMVGTSAFDFLQKRFQDSKLNLHFFGL